MSVSITNIEGIGPARAQLLSNAGVRSTRDLLRVGATRNGRRTLSIQTGIDEGMILKWVNMCDLFRIKGVATQYAELLEAAGVDTVKELRNRSSENLTRSMIEINSQKRLVRQTPGLGMVNQWIEQARSLDPVVMY